MNRQTNLNNRSQQLNPNNDAYWQSRGFHERPDDWEELLEKENSKEQVDSKDEK